MLIVTAAWLGAMAAYVFLYPDYIVRLAISASAVALLTVLWRKIQAPIRNLFRDLAILHGFYVLIGLFTPIARGVSAAPPILDSASKSEFYLVAAASNIIFVLVLAYISVYAIGKTALDIRSGWKKVSAGVSTFRRSAATLRREKQSKTNASSFRHDQAVNAFKRQLDRTYSEFALYLQAFRQAAVVANKDDNKKKPRS